MEGRGRENPKLKNGGRKGTMGKEDKGPEKQDRRVITVAGKHLTPNPECQRNLAVTRVAGDTGGHSRACRGNRLFAGPGADSEGGCLPYFGSALDDKRFELGALSSRVPDAAQAHSRTSPEVGPSLSGRGFCHTALETVPPAGEPWLLTGLCAPQSLEHSPRSSNSIRKAHY